MEKLLSKARRRDGVKNDKDFFFEKYTVQIRQPQRTNTHLYEHTHANPTAMRI